MTPEDALAHVRAAEVEVTLDGEDLRLRAPPGVLTTERLAWLRTHKRALVEALTGPADPLPALYLEVFSDLPAGRALVTLEPDQARRAVACGSVPAETAASSVLLAYRAPGGERCMLAIPTQRYEGLAILQALEGGTWAR